MDEITKAKTDAFQKMMKSFKLKGKAILDYWYIGEINVEEASAPKKAFHSFVDTVLALSNRNDGNVTTDEIDAICRINDKFQGFFIMSEQSTGFVDQLEAENRAWSMMTSHGQSKKYHDIIQKMEEVSTDNFINDMSDQERKKHEAELDEMLVFMPKTKWLHGLFGIAVDCKQMEYYRGSPFILIKKQNVANDFVPKPKSPTL